MFIFDTVQTTPNKEQKSMSSSFSVKFWQNYHKLFKQIFLLISMPKLSVVTILLLPLLLLLFFIFLRYKMGMYKYLHNKLHLSWKRKFNRRKKKRDVFFMCRLPITFFFFFFVPFFPQSQRVSNKIKECNGERKYTIFFLLMFYCIFMYVKGRYKNDDGERQIRVSEKKSFKKRWKQQRLCSIATAVSQKKENNRVSNGEKKVQ